MKYALFFLTSLFLAGRANSQTAQQPTLKVQLIRTALTVTYMNQPLTIRDLHTLDSLVKKIPDPQQAIIDYETENADPEQSLAIIRTLEKCNCHLRVKSSAVKKK